MDTLFDQGKTFLIANGTTNNPKYGRRVTTTELITPEMAKEILASCTPDHQRDVAVNHVKHFADLMQQGEFGASTLVFTRLPGEPRSSRGKMQDGFHRVHGQIRAGMAVWFNIDTYELLSEEEAGGLYADIDVYTRARSFAARFKAHGGGDGIAPNILNSMKNTVDHLRNGLLIPHVKSYDQAEMETAVMDIKDAYLLYHDIAAWANKQEVQAALRRKCIATVAIATLKYAEDKALAERFWISVAERRFVGDDFHPVTAMYDFLKESTSGHHGDARRVFTMDDAQTLVAVNYWNSYVNGTNVLYNLAVTPSDKFLDWMKSLGAEHKKVNKIQLAGVPLIFRKGAAPEPIKA